MKLKLLPLLLVLALAALAGCAVAAPTDTGAAEPAAEAADEGVAGEYVPTPRDETVIVNEIGGNWDVWESYNLLAPNAAAPGIWQAAQEHLFNINWATGDFVYWLAESYEYNDDFTQLTIKTRPEAHWNDGTAFTAHDVKFSIEMVQSEIALQFGSTMQEWVASVEASDDHTVVIDLTKSNPRFHMNFARAWGFPVQAKHVWEGNDPLEFKNYPPVFTGPYKLYQEFPDQAMNIWVKDENYWGMDGMGVEVGPTYYVTRLERVPETEIADVKVNKIDHPHALGDATLMQAAVDANPAIQLAGWRDPCPRAIWFNNAKYPLSLPEVRHAINAAVNRQKVADLLFGVPTVPARFPWADWGVHDKYSFEDIRAEFELDYDIDRGNAILDELGFMPGNDGIRIDGEGNPMEFQINVPGFANTEYNIAFDLSEELAKMGIKANVKRIEGQAMWDSLDNGNFDMSSHWFCGDWAEGPLTFSDWKHTNITPIGEKTNTGNRWRVNIPELTEVMNQIEQMSPNDPAIEDLYRQAVRLYFEHLPGLAIVQTTYVMPFNWHYWDGWPTSDNVYAVPFTWWPEFKYVMFSLEPTGN